MANMPDVRKRTLSVKITRELYYRLRNASRGTFSEWVRNLLENDADRLGAELYPSDITRIRREVKEAMAKRKSRPKTR